jgi:hypothetical protein
MLPLAVRAVLDCALQKFRPGRSEPILVGGISLLKPALRLMSSYRLVIEEVTDAGVITNYTRWVDSVQLWEAEKAGSLPLVPSSSRSTFNWFPGG